MTETTNGKDDAISLLYSDKEVDEYVSFPSENQNGYDVLDNGNGTDISGPTWTMKMLVSGTFRSLFSIEPGQNLLTSLNVAD